MFKIYFISIFIMILISSCEDSTAYRDHFTYNSHTDDADDADDSVDSPDFDHSQTYSGSDVKDVFKSFAKTQNYPKSDQAAFNGGNFTEILNSSAEGPTCVECGNKNEYNSGPTKARASGPNGAAVDSDFFSYLTSVPTAQGKSCNKTYKSSFSSSNIRSLSKNINSIINADVAVVKPGVPSGCLDSNCVTASYMAFIKKARNRPDWEKKKKKFRFGGALYSRFGSLKEGKKPVGLQGAMQEFYGPEYDPKKHFYNLKPRDVKTVNKNGILAKGDLIRMKWVPRTNSKGKVIHGAHLAVFDKMEGDKLCFWSSNKPGQRPAKDGPGRKCTNISKMTGVELAKI